MEKHYDFKQTEKQMQQFWQESAIYRFEHSDSKPVYSIDTPPPTVSGSLHIGHIFSYAQAEMIARFRRMQGENVFYPFGFDDNGLPTERLVERDEGIQAKDLPRSEFISLCLKTTETYEKEFEELWKSLGFSVDWSLRYKTIEPRVQRISQKSFIELYRKGKAYMKESPVLWCTECRTSIAQAELETMDKETNFHFLRFYSEGEELLVATTRPELLYGCVCLFVNPQDKRYTGLIGKTAIVPLYNYTVPILTDEKVAIEKGTGVVMCCTYGDSTDAQWVEKYSLPYRKVILPDGTMDEKVPFIAGLSITKARKEIVRCLTEHNLLVKSEELTHTVAVHERCGKEIEILPSRQWYIDILSNKTLYLQAAEKINWYPEHMKKRYILWVENLKWDWCISRQRYYGVPFPLWYCKHCGNVILADDKELPLNPLETKPNRKCTCGSDEFTPESAVLDTWATSSVSPLINANWGEENDFSGKFLPMSMRTQAHEIIRTWAFYTIVKSLYHTGEIPWKDIMICGYVLAKKGEKISKSKNNADQSPQALIENHSADAIRYWAASSRLGTDTFFSVDDLAISKRFLTKLWNAARFSISQLSEPELGIETEYLPVDRWIMERCRQTTFQAAEYLNQYEVGLARQTMDDFFWKDFCDYYLEIAKERLYQPDTHGVEENRSAKHALYFCMLNVLKLYGIFVPYITEYIYQQYFRCFEKTLSLHLLTWEKDAGKIDDEIIAFGEKLKEIVANVRKYKSENNLSMKTEMDELSIDIETSMEEMFRKTVGDIKACCRSKTLYLNKEQF
ncbi:MAG: valine--tRNA ligase [Thermoclostridium sp.]|nr:valine--tRNA ligase [Thermoclostridium sp.]